MEAVLHLKIKVDLLVAKHNRHHQHGDVFALFQPINWGKDTSSVW